jgi:putative transposase
MITFIDEHRQSLGVEPICCAMPIAPSTYYESKAQQADPEKLSPRRKRDAILRVKIRHVWEELRDIRSA